MEEKLTKITPFDFGVVGNANFFNKIDGKWYADSVYSILANDDTAGITAFFKLS
ncbi:hypothetical protein RCO48_16480 [Peribacillus frigoritolerans]|nr:hypothetical protein [Peribacillus frigoritolerans]